MTEAVVIGGSAGSMPVIMSLLKILPQDYPIPVIIVVHLHATDDGGLATLLDSQMRVPVVVPLDKQPIAGPKVYIAPANYHLLVEHDKTFALSIDTKVKYSRPSIDVLFESAAFVYRENLVGVLLSGASSDGAEGMGAIKHFGGRTLVQDPQKAEHTIMPLSAIDAGYADGIFEEAFLLDL